MSEDKLYEKAERRADAKIGFYRHLYSFIAVNVAFIVMGLIFQWGTWWFYIAGLWAIGLIFHFLKVFVFSEKIDSIDRDQMIKKEMEKMKK